MHDFTPLPALLGGLLVGASATLLYATHGRTAGISGLFGGLLRREVPDRALRLAFLAGLAAAGVVAAFVAPQAFGPPPPQRSGLVLAVAGLLVGYGTQLGGGCTSGHGVCGLSRGSTRSLVATLTFMLTAGVTVALAGRLLGGAS